MRGPPKPPTYVYFMYSGGRIKIGFATDAHLRHAGLCGMSPLPVTMLLCLHGDRKTERGLHKQFDADRLHGEWFEFSPALRAFITERLTATVGGITLLARAEADFSEFIAARSPHETRHSVSPLPYLMGCGPA